MNNNDIYFLAGMIFSILMDIIVEPIRRKWRKECNFECKNCKVFDCSKFDCDRQKEKFLKKKQKEQ